MRLLQDVWHPRARCKFGVVSKSGKWVRMFGFPAHLWCNPTMKAIGEVCSGYIQTDFGDEQSMEWI